MMNDDNPLIKLSEELSHYETRDLAASVAALQLVPQNADCLIRLAVLAHVVASMKPAQSSVYISPHRLKRICNTVGVGDPRVASQDDPANELLTEAVPFFGREYIVFPGTTEYSASTLQALIYTIFRPGSPFAGTSFSQEAYRLVKAALLLSDAVALKAGLARGVEPVPNTPREVRMPSAADFNTLKQAARFARPDLEELLEDGGVSVEDLVKLVCSPSSFSVEECEPGEGPLNITPLVDLGSDMVLAIPGMLPSALGHALILLALEHELGGELARQLNAYSWNSVLRSLDFLNIEPSVALSRKASPRVNVRDGFFKLDADKCLYTVLITEDWLDYTPDSCFGRWPPGDLQGVLRERIRDAVDYHGQAFPWSKRLFILLLVQTTGRSVSLPIEDILPQGEKGYDFLFLTVPDMDVLSVIEQGNGLALWKFARAWERLQQRAAVLSWSQLDAYYFYREHKHSFYFNDDRRPDMINLDSGFSGILRREAHRRRDPHFALSPDRRSVFEVICYRGDRRLPLYAPPRLVNNQLMVLVEGDVIPIWVTSGSSVPRENPQLRQACFMLIDTAAYWLWRFAPDLSPILRVLGDRFPNLSIELLLPPGEDWESSAFQLGDGEGEPLEYRSSPGLGAVTIVAHRALLDLCATPDNQGERQLMACTLRALSHLLPVPETLSEDVIARIIDRRAPVGAQKMAILPKSRSLFLLDDLGLPAFRKVQEADVEELLDELGSYLTDTVNLKPKVIPESDCVALINMKVVPFFYQEFCRIMAQLSPEGLLESLVKRHEATLREQRFLTLTAPTRLRCFDFDLGLEERIHQEQYDTDTAALMNRFLIEYVAAQPPSGKEPLSVASYDRLLALARQIINYGFSSDLLHYKLGHLRFAMLESGRLGEDRDQFEAARRTYGKLFSSGRILNAKQTFHRFWEGEGSRKEQPAVMHAEDNAMRAEFGYSLTEMAELLFWMTDQGIRRVEPVVSMPVEEMANAFAATLSWDKEKAALLISLFSLRPRSDYLKPPEGFEGYDVWPWRFNRRLSYLRRPILIRRGHGVDEAVWGPKHTYQAGAYLTDLLLSGRIAAATGKEHSQVMRRYQSRSNNLRGREFEMSVITALREVPFLRVLNHVTRVGQQHVGGDGEIDAIVANTKKKIVFVLECKDLSLARTPYEMGQQITQLYNDDADRKSATSQVLTKAAWVSSRLRDVLNELGVAGPAKQWKIKPLIVTDERLFTSYFISPKVPIVPFEEIVSAICR